MPVVLYNDFLKIDTESFEFEALTGAQDANNFAYGNFVFEGKTSRRP
jgi:hypothetical protein